MNELTLKDAIQELEEIAIGDLVPYEYSPEEAKLILNHINNLQLKIDNVNKILDKYAKTEVEDYKKIIKFYKELRNVLKEDK